MATKESLLEKYATVQMLVGHMNAHGRPNSPFADRSRGQGRVLALLKLRDGISTREMAGVLGLRTSSLNETLAKLEKAGVIERRPSEQDKRVMLAFLTEKGRNQQQDGGTSEFDLFAGFSDEEMDALEAFFDRMIANLEQQLGPERVEQLKQAARMRDEMVARIMAGEDMPEGMPNRPAPPKPPAAHAYGNFGDARMLGGFHAGGFAGGFPEGFSGGHMPGFGEFPHGRACESSDAREEGAGC